MAEKTTFIKIDRNILRWRWYRNSNTKSVFLHLLLTANVADNDFETITVHRGQLVISRKHLALELGMSEQEVRTALDHLKSTSEITSKAYAKYTVITILNYDMYQKVTRTSTSNQPTTNQQSTSNQPQYKNNKNNKKEKNNALQGECHTDFDVQKYDF